MKVNVSAILKEIGGRIEIDDYVYLNDTDFLGETYHFDEPVRVKGHISNTGECLILSAVCDGTLTTQCARCMKDTKASVKFKIDESLVRDGSEIQDEDVIVFVDDDIDIDDIVADNFLLNVEGKYLCSDDCKGLCPNCGADLNEGECGCDRDDVDPRWSALVEIMNENK